MRNLTAIVAGVVALSGCAAYQEPTSGSTATLTVRHAAEEGTSVYAVYKDRLCAAHPGGTNFYTSMGTMGAPTKKIPAGQEFVLTGTWLKAGMGVGYRCSETASFVPEDGKVYVATIVADMKTNRCSLGIEEQAAGGTRPVTSYRKNADLCYGAENAGPMNNGRFNNIQGGASTVTR
jgi:hypothetical protein